jgi:replicative DNA helicase
MTINYVPERDLLQFLLRREFYDSYFDSLDLNHIKDEYKELYYVYKVLQSLHRDYVQDFNLEDLQAAFFTTYPDLDKEIYLELFKTLSETKIDPTLSEAAFKFSTGAGELTPVNELLEELNNDNPETTEEFEFVTGDLEQLLHEVYQDKGLRWRLDCLNKSLGSLRKGNFGFLFARPESGKTTFLASEISNMLRTLPSDKGPIVQQ